MPTRQEQLQQIVNSAVPGQATSEQIAAYMELNPGVTAEQVYKDMVAYGVSPEQFAQATGIPVARVSEEYANQQAIQRARSIPTGLYGYEQALQQGLEQSTGTMRQAQEQAAGQLGAGYEDVARMYGLNIDELRQAGQAARGDIERTFGQAGQMFQPYQEAGTTALQQQLALSGALGQEAFNQAYQESPYMQFLREQGERSTLAGAAATGGLGGGRVQQELVRYGQGLASQGLQQQYQNLAGLSGMGMEAAGAGANIQTGLGTNLANLLTGTAQNVAGQRQGQIGERSQYGANLANLSSSTGTNIANLQAQAALNLAQQRADAGQLLAGQIGATSVGLGNLATAQGTDLANTLSQYGTAGLNLSQGYTADQIAANQAAAAQAAANQKNYAAQQAALYAWQQYTPPPTTNYSGMIGNALDAASLGYELGGYFQQPQTQAANPLYGPLRTGYQTGQTQVPYGTVSSGVPGYPSFNVLSPTEQAFRLSGRI